MLLIAGVPLGESVVRYGPFVMNTEDEIARAIQDYNTGKMGKIDF
jgi:redox-sensitive bicupin YhaK (pirin superfamily)